MAGSTFGYVPSIRIAQDRVEPQFTCTALEVIGDLVVLSLTSENTVAKISSNVYNGLVIGVIVQKLNATTCIVRTQGSYVGGAGYTKGKAVFVDTLGLPTTTRPASGHLQVIGVASGATSFFIQPNMQKVILS